MKYVCFVSGHLDLTQEEFDEHYVPLLEDTRDAGCGFVAGDASGCDLMAQRYFVDNRCIVNVYHMFDSPRNNVGEFPTIGGFTSDKERDEAMTAASFGEWDSRRSLSTRGSER